MSTLCVLYTPHFPHSRIQNTLQSMFSTFHTPRYPQFTLHYTALSLPLLPSPSHGLAPKFPTPPSPRAVSQTNSIPLPCWTPAMQAITHSSFSTLYTTLHLACPSPPPPIPLSHVRSLAPKFPSPSISNACHVGLTVLLVFHTTHSCFYRQPFILPVKSTFLNLSAD